MNEKFVPAFKEKLGVSEFDKPIHPTPRLYEFEHDKRFIIRPMDDFFEEDQFSTLEEAGQYLKSLFNELRSVYGIDAPVHFVVATNEKGENQLYNFTERIVATDVGALVEPEKIRMKDGLIKIFESLVAYYEEKEKNGKDFLSDIPEVEQYVYGTRGEEKTARWYLVDTDPFSSSSKEILFEVAESIDVAISSIEEGFDVDMKPLHDRVMALQNKIEADLSNDQK